MRHATCSTLIFAIVLPFVLGQGCPPPAPTASRGIPAGDYSGEVTCAYTVTVDSDGGQETVAQETSSYTIVREFGADGRELTAQGTSLQVGDGNTVLFGPGVVEGIVTSVGVDTGFFQALYQVVMSIDLEGESLFFAGSNSDEYTLNADGSVAYQGKLDVLSEVMDGEVGRIKGTCTGTLR